MQGLQTIESSTAKTTARCHLIQSGSKYKAKWERKALSAAATMLAQNSMVNLRPYQQMSHSVFDDGTLFLRRQALGIVDWPRIGDELRLDELARDGASHGGVSV
jgi:hypothetical protein